MAEIRRNLRRHTFHSVFKSSNNVQDTRNYVFQNSDIVQDIQDVASSSTTLNISFNREYINIDNESSSSSDDSEISELFSLSQNISNKFSEPFSERLASCFVDNNLTHVQCNSVLALLRTHPCFSTLPKDVRIILNTPRNCITISKVEPGEYIHFDVEKKIVENLSNTSLKSVTELELDFNTDGCNLDKSSTVHIWPIQCRIVNLQHTKPIVVGIYKGTHKPNDPNAFFQKFVADINSIMCNGGITFNDFKIPIRLRCFIADAPARAFILNHRSHVSTQPCSKCKVCGTYTEGRLVFRGINHSLRTDEEYIRCLDEDHHKEGRSPLSLIPIGMVSQVPFHYMHLVCLGVMKKLLSAWVHGKYSNLTKLLGRSLSIINTKINILQKYCPSDFARRPRSFEVCSKYKSTEFRQFLLYTGPVIMYGLLEDYLYKHFLFLHTALRVLVSKSPSKQHLIYAEAALQKFVLRCENLYGTNFVSYNVHGLLHFIDDVKHLGNLDSFSAFPYENNMSIFRKYCRKPGLPLQQFFNRMTEIQIHGTSKECNVDSSTRASLLRNHTNCLQYRNINFNNILLSIDKRNNCCILYNGSICIVNEIVKNNESFRLTVKQFLSVIDFYDTGMKSSSFQFYKCTTLSNDSFYVSLNEIRAKCYRMPFWNCSLIDDCNSDENEPLEIQYIIAVIIHNENM